VEVFEIFSFGSNEHVSHEKSMIGTSADNADFDPVFLIPSRKPINNIDAVPCVQVIDSSFSVDSPYLTKITLVSEL